MKFLKILERVTQRYSDRGGGGRAFEARADFEDV